MQHRRKFHKGDAVRSRASGRVYITKGIKLSQSLRKPSYYFLVLEDGCDIAFSVGYAEAAFDTIYRSRTAKALKFIEMFV